MALTACCFALSCAAVWFVTVNRTPPPRHDAKEIREP